jgi:aminoglycoside phosphotransferase (APT) family kinase protein
MGPSDSLIRWAGTVAGGDVTVVRGLRRGGSPWLVRVGGASPYDAVLRVEVADNPNGIATEAAALQVAHEHDVRAPRLIAADPHGADAGLKALLQSAVPGSSRIPLAPGPERLRAAGAAISALHRVPHHPTDELPLRTRPIATSDFAAERRVPGGATTPLLDAAADRIAAFSIPATDPVLVHGDMWHGNLLWRADRVVAILDWELAGVGPHGVDLGSLRLDAALLYGMEAADLVLDGWLRTSRRPLAALQYWDAVAALNTPTDMARFITVIHDQGRDDLDADMLNKRRDLFLSFALKGLGTDPLRSTTS